ncbi:RNA-binding motif protein, X-linked 2 [Bemisia tabaci]|uniref:RNA-binding motif protein, X-linked 2 n=1 Tax=Bemisia tabaci TaxID=7038 RepID=UPI0008F9DFB0|nr:PREDICTED: RNA-binding motif protein, X-linked 2-like [Bemisia tabaci]
MNPLTNIKNVKKLSEQELERGSKSSWHDQYKDSAWIFVGGIPYDLTEGDVLCVFSQFGEIVNMNMVRDKATGKHKGFGFICFEDQRSTILTVDNLNGMKLLGRTIRVDHCQDYKPPKDSEKLDPEVRRMRQEGCAPSVSNQSAAKPLPVPVENIKRERESVHRHIKKEPSEGKYKRERHRSPSSSHSSSDSSSDSDSRRKKKKKKEKEKFRKDVKRERDVSLDVRYSKKDRIKREPSSDGY